MRKALLGLLILLVLLLAASCKAEVEQGLSEDYGEFSFLQACAPEIPAEKGKSDSTIMVTGVEGITVDGKWAYYATCNSTYCLTGLKRIDLSKLYPITTTNPYTETEATQYMYDVDSGDNWYAAYLGHANDMSIAHVSGRTFMFITTRTLCSEKDPYYSTAAQERYEANSQYEKRVVVVEINEEDATYELKKCYTVKNGSSTVNIMSLDVMEVTDSSVKLIMSAAQNLWDVELPISDLLSSATTGTMTLTNKRILDGEASGTPLSGDPLLVEVDGQEYDLIGFNRQGFGHYRNLLYVPYTEGNRTIVCVYDLNEEGTTLHSIPERNMYLCQDKAPAEEYNGAYLGEYYGFEVEAFGFTSNGKCYFVANRTLHKDGSRVSGIPGAVWDGFFSLNVK